MLEILKKDMIAAMKAKDANKLGILRLMVTTIKNFEIDSPNPITDADIIRLIKKQIKQSQESLTDYKNAGRPDDASREQSQIDILNAYLPPAPSHEEVHQIVMQGLQAFTSPTLKDMGKIMQHIKPQLPENTDMKLVTDLIKQHLD